MSTHRVIRPTIVSLVCLVGASAPADLLHFVEGGAVELPASIQGVEIILDTPMGQLRFPQRDFLRIDATEDPSREWPARRARAISGGAPERLAAALWALDFGLVAEAETMLREAHACDPKHQPTARMVGLLDRLRLPLPDPEMTHLLRGLPADRRIARGPHVLLFHQHSEADADERIAVLERVITAYYLSFANLGLELAPPRCRLPSVWFAHRADYLSFLRAEGAGAFSTTRGYHHPTRGMVAAYDCRDDSPRQRQHEELRTRRHDLDQLALRIEAIPPGGRGRIAVPGRPPRLLDREEAQAYEATLRRQIDRAEMVMEITRREIDWGIAAHETVHQLVVASGLCPRVDTFPNWFHEGLAMQFETIRGGRWAGLHPPSPLRLRDYRHLSPRPTLDSTIRESRPGRGYDRDGYARSWALVYFLRNAESGTFLALIDGLRLPAQEGENPFSRTLKIVRSSLHYRLDAVDVTFNKFMDEISNISSRPASGDLPH